MVQLSEEAIAILDRAFEVIQDGPLPETFFYDLRSPSPAAQPDPRPAGEPEPSRLEANISEVMRLRQGEISTRARVSQRAAIMGSTVGERNYTYRTGPNGQRYITGGDAHPDFDIASTPEETLNRVRLLQALALAPADGVDHDSKIVLQSTDIVKSAKEAMRNRRVAMMDQRMLEFHALGERYMTKKVTNGIEQAIANGHQAFKSGDPSVIADTTEIIDPSNIVPLPMEVETARTVAEIESAKTIAEVEGVQTIAAVEGAKAASAVTAPPTPLAPTGPPTVENGEIESPRATGPPEPEVIWEPRNEMGFSFRSTLMASTYNGVHLLGYFPLGGNADAFI